MKRRLFWLLCKAFRGLDIKVVYLHDGRQWIIRKRVTLGKGNSYIVPLTEKYAVTRKRYVSMWWPQDHH